MGKKSWGKRLKRSREQYRQVLVPAFRAIEHKLHMIVTTYEARKQPRNPWFWFFSRERFFIPGINKNGLNSDHPFVSITSKHALIKVIPTTEKGRIYLEWNVNDVGLLKLLIIQHFPDAINLADRMELRSVV